MTLFLKVHERGDVVDFVKEVERHPCLYNRHIRDYSDKIKQSQAWADIAKKMGTIAADCREKWRKIRISYIRSLKVQCSDKPGRPYYLSKYLNFLKPFVRDQDGNSYIDQIKNIDSNDKEDSESSLDSIQDNEVGFIDVSDKIPKLEVTDSHSENATEVRTHSELENASSARQMFLSSLMPEIESFSDQEMRTFRRQVIGIIDQIISDRERN